MPETTEIQSKAQPRRQKAYELLHLLCKMIDYHDEVKIKGPYGNNFIAFKAGAGVSEADLKRIYGFDDELLDFFKLQVAKHAQ